MQFLNVTQRLHRKVTSTRTKSANANHSGRYHTGTSKQICELSMGDSYHTNGLDRVTFWKSARTGSGDGSGDGGGDDGGDGGGITTHILISIYSI